MRIRRVDIDHFRGIKSMRWTVPLRGFCALIGPGDATKSTVLTAIERALSARHTVLFTDTDFHDADLDQPISIRVTVDQLTDELAATDGFGQHLCGITEAGDLQHDPHDDADPCVIIELRVEADLEPRWLYWHPPVDLSAINGEGDPDPTEAEAPVGADTAEPAPGVTQEIDRQPVAVRATLRAKLGVYRIDERVDAHLRWSRTSALGRLTEARAETKGATKNVLTEAGRRARQAVADSPDEDLQALALEVQQRVERLGTRKFGQLSPGLDLSLTNAQGNLALYHGAIPLTSHGLGTRRLTGAAAQQLAHPGSAILLVDEVEYGLEPHRLAHLLGQLRKPGEYSQVFITTHSPTALQHLTAADLVTVRSNENAITVMRSLVDPSGLQGVVERTPAAFLSRLVVVCEGKTEVGLVTAKLAAWAEADASGVPAAAVGVSVVNGNGGEQTLTQAALLHEVGYPVAVVIDSDVPNTVSEAEAFSQESGCVVVRWTDTLNTERAVCAELDADGLTELVALHLELVAADVGDADDAAGIVRNQLSQQRGAVVDDLDIAHWIGAGFSLDAARAVISSAATTKSRAWFKTTFTARRLGEFVASRPGFSSGAMASQMQPLFDAVYGDRGDDDSDVDEQIVVRPSGDTSPDAG